jgi:hypothetical protein
LKIGVAFAESIRRVEMRQFIGPFDVLTGRKPKGANKLLTAFSFIRENVVSCNSAWQKQTDKDF